MLITNLRKYLILFLSLIIANVFAISLPASKPQSPILDLSNTLSQSQQQSIVNNINQIYRYESKTEIQVVIVPSLDGAPIDELSLATARKWHLGQKNLNNGILFLIAIKDKQYRIEVGYGLEGVLPDGYIGNLERSVVAPNFRKGDYYKGIQLAIINLGSSISSEYKNHIQQGQSTKSQKSATLSPQETIILIIISIAFIVFVSYCVVTGNYQLLFNVIFFVFQLFILFGGRGGGRGGGNRDDSDGDFGGGGTSGRW